MSTDRYSNINKMSKTVMKTIQLHSYTGNNYFLNNFSI